MTENKRFTVQSDAHAEEIKLLIDKEQMIMWSFLHHDEAVNNICGLLNILHEENMMLRSKHTRLIILLKDIVNDLKRMDTKGYAEHIEKMEGVAFLMEDLE